MKAGGASRGKQGDRGEEEAAEFLEERGYLIEARQWRCRFGELDLVARAPDGILCFVEVKLRGRNTPALPREYVDRRKQGRLRRAAALYLAEHAPEAVCRFDVAEVYVCPDGSARVVYLPGAFE